jgi:hypothetical protein
MNNLEEQKEKLTEVLNMLVETNHYGAMETPELTTNRDKGWKYFGQHIILPKNDTEIVYKGDDKFTFVDFHNEDEPEQLYTKEQIVDFYDGSYAAYGVPVMFEYITKKPLDSYHFCKGYYETMCNLIMDLKQEIEEYESKNK